MSRDTTSGTPVLRGSLRTILTAFAIVLAMALCAVPKASAEFVITPVTPPVPTGSTKGIVALAKRELNRKVVERKSNNIPRYKKGKGRIAPYSIGDAWCVAFATWVWGQNGFTDYLGTKFLRTSYDKSLVAIQVTDLTRWAKKYGHYSTRAKPGYLVAYSGTHIGIVTNADRTGRAVKSIEGNKSDAVTRVTISMPDVTGYISPTALTPSQVSKMRTLRPDM